MSEAGGLPADWSPGEAYAVRTFDVRDGVLSSIAQSGGHWEDGICIATCIVDADHAGAVPVEGCSCGVYAFWTIEELLGQYADYAKRMVAVIRFDGDRIEGDNGTKAARAEIVAWWVSDCDDTWIPNPKQKFPTTAQYLDACAATVPEARRYFDRDVMLDIYPAPPSTQRHTR